METMKKHYETLGLNQDASQEEVQRAYDKLSGELNPANHESKAFFQEEFDKVQKAYEALTTNTSILKNDSVGLRTNTDLPSGDASASTSSSSSGSVSITISAQKIEELKNRPASAENQNHSKPSMFRNPFGSDGRIRRMEFGLSFIIFYFGAMISLALAATAPVLYWILYIAFVWFNLSQGAKRCHDLGHSGWYQLIPFYALWMLFQDGKIGPNEYGENPKGINKIN
jgi:curved DNA-binding protein CbpA